MAELDAAAFGATLGRAISENGIGGMLSFDRVRVLTAMTERLLSENEKYNLTALTEPGKIALLHYADCALIAGYMKKGATVIDVGCGAGFPTLPLAVLRPDLRLLAVDSTEKKVAYVRETAHLFGLDNVTCLTARAEDLAADGTYRENFDYATARAVTEMRALSELLLPFVKIGGEMIAMKGKNAAYEAAGAKRALAILGGEVVSIDETPLRSAAYGEQSHAVIRVAKRKKTPAAYPRAWAQISKKPL